MINWAPILFRKRVRGSKKWRKYIGYTVFVRNRIRNKTFLIDGTCILIKKSYNLDINTSVGVRKKFKLNAASFLFPIYLMGGHNYYKFGYNYGKRHVVASRLTQKRYFKY